MLTQEQIAEIKARHEAATPGVWSDVDYITTSRGQGQGEKIPFRSAFVYPEPPTDLPYPASANRAPKIAECYSQSTHLGDLNSYDVAANIAFIAHAHQDIPALLQHIEELESQLRAP